MSDLWIVTVKLVRNLDHDPQHKQTGPCQFSEICTDVTGEHHSFLMAGPESLVRDVMRRRGVHITRIERAQDPDKDWFEAFAEAVHRIGKKWPDQLTSEEITQCGLEADKVAIRPESEWYDVL